MHRAVASALNRSREAIAIVVNTRPGISVLLAFSRSSPSPLWVAKVSSDPKSTLSLQREYRALEVLRPWASDLNVPAIRDWVRDDRSACLIVSGVAGWTEPVGLAAETGATDDLRRLELATAWLRRFRATVPLSAVEQGIEDRGDRFPTLANDADRTVEVARLLDFLDGCRNQETAPTPSHGDFWWGNLCFDGSRLGVIDWEGLRSGNRLHDLFVLHATLSHFEKRRLCTDVNVDIFLKRFFSKEAGACSIQKTMRAADPSSEEIRRSFYLFVATMIDLNTGAYRGPWLEILKILDRHGYPEPWSCFLRPPAAGSPLRGRSLRA
jgi:aminoglycoside phosphotransferase